MITYLICSTLTPNVKEWGGAYETYNATTISNGALTDYWLDLVTLPDARDQPLFYVKIYAVIGSFTAILSVGSTVVQCIVALGASRSLFSRLLRTVVHATMHWHDITPSGKGLSHL